MSPETVVIEKKEISKTAKFLEIIKERGISFDIDAVEAATSRPAVKLFYENYGKVYGCIKYVQDLSGYWSMIQWFKEVERICPGTIEDPKKASISIWNNREVQGFCLPETGSLALARFLAAHDILPDRISSRPDYMYDITLEWYRRYHPLLDPSKIHIQKDGISDDNFKKNRSRELNVGFHLEDSPKHAEKVAETGAWVGLVPQPWGLRYQPPADLHIIIPKDYIGRPPIIRAFLSLRDAYMEDYYTRSHNIDKSS